VRVRREDLDAFIAAGASPPPKPLEPAVPDQLAAEMERAVEALRDANSAELAAALRSVARAARSLAKAIERDASG
jgi:hypothetical protein